MVLQGCKSTPQKSRAIESGHRRHAVQVANVCSYKLGQKYKFQFWCELGWFLHAQSHISKLRIRLIPYSGFILHEIFHSLGGRHTDTDTHTDIHTEVILRNVYAGLWPACAWFKNHTKYFKPIKLFITIWLCS